MKYTGLTDRPPFEARSLLLQVTAGCSHNRCAFCTMYREVPFAAETMEQIEKDLREAREYVPNMTRVFLENGDPGCPLYDDMQSGTFRESTFGEYLEEEERFLSLLDLEGCYYFGLHPSNLVQMHGYLNRDKKEMLDIVQRRRKQLSDRLPDRPVRGGEGAILNA